MTPALQASCLDALIAALDEVSTTVLGGEGAAPLPSQRSSGPGHGAYLSLNAGDEPVQVGLAVSPEGCQALAKALLGMDVADEDLPSADVSDAMCEVINMVAGGLKRRVSPGLPITLGLPIFVAGQALPNHQQEVSSRSVALGDVAVSVILLTQNEAAPLSRGGQHLRIADVEPAKEHSV